MFFSSVHEAVQSQRARAQLNGPDLLTFSFKVWVSILSRVPYKDMILKKIQAAAAATTTTHRFSAHIDSHGSPACSERDCYIMLPKKKDNNASDLGLMRAARFGRVKNTLSMGFGKRLEFALWNLRDINALMFAMDGTFTCAQVFSVLSLEDERLSAVTVVLTCARAVISLLYLNANNSSFGFALSCSFLELSMWHYCLMRYAHCHRASPYRKMRSETTHA
jgi:hypothetical protein